jgi:hypothetical protein
MGMLKIDLARKYHRKREKESGGNSPGNPPAGEKSPTVARPNGQKKFQWVLQSCVFYVYSIAIFLVYVSVVHWVM